MKKKHLQSGMTLIEMLLAMGITALMCGGLYTMGIMLRRSSEGTRIATEARAFAKERLEEIIALGLEDAAKSSCTLFETTLGKSSTGAVIQRTPSVVWHTYDGAVVTNASTADYAEVNVRVTYPTPLMGKMLTDTYSTIVN